MDKGEVVLGDYCTATEQRGQANLHQGEKKNKELMLQKNHRADRTRTNTGTRKHTQRKRTAPTGCRRRQRTPRGAGNTRREAQHRKSKHKQSKTNGKQNRPPNRRACFGIPAVTPCVASSSGPARPRRRRRARSGGPTCGTKEHTEAGQEQ